MKIQRLFAILVTLLNKRKVTAKELASRFEVSTRTIYRDIDDLSAAGIPIYANKGSGGGIALLDHYTLNKTLITEEDSQELMLALKALESRNYPDIDQVTEKLSALFHSMNVDDWIEIDRSGWDNSKEPQACFDTIKSSIIDCQQIVFDYYNQKGEITRRSVHPLKLKHKGEGWYLWAYCLLKKDFRLFRLERIKAISLEEHFFNRMDYTQREDYDYKGHDVKEWVDLVLRFNEKGLYRVYCHYDQEEFRLTEDGRYELKTSMPCDDWVVTFIEFFGSDVEVIEPQWLRQRMKERLSLALERYNK